MGVANRFGPTGLHDRHREAFSPSTCFPHPIRPSATFPASRRRGARCRHGHRGFDFIMEKRASRVSKRSANPIDDDRQSADHEIIGKPQHPIPLAPKPRVSLSVSGSRFSGIVRHAVRFDDQLPGKTNEVGKVRTHRRLPAKAVSVQAMIAQRLPQQGFRPSSYCGAEREQTCARTDGSVAAAPLYLRTAFRLARPSMANLIPQQTARRTHPALRATFPASRRRGTRHRDERR